MEVHYLPIHIYLIYVRGGAGSFFRGGGSGRGRGEAISHDRCTRFFFDAAEWPQTPGEARGKQFPTIAAPDFF